MATDDNQLVTLAKENQLDDTRVSALLADFGDPFQKAQALVEEARSIVVTSEDQKDLMIESSQEASSAQRVTCTVRKDS
jgi:hypothetical protein